MPFPLNAVRLLTNFSMGQSNTAISLPQTLSSFGLALPLTTNQYVFSMKEFHYTDKNGNSLGPVSLNDLRKFRSQGTIDDSTWVFEVGTADWVALSTIVLSPPMAKSISTRAVSEKPRTTKSFNHQAATASILTPVAAILLNLLGNAALASMDSASRATGARIIGIFAGLIMLSGILFGIIGLCGIPKYGKKGLLGKSIAGIAIPLVFIVLAIPALMRLSN